VADLQSIAGFREGGMFRVNSALTWGDGSSIVLPRRAELSLTAVRLLIFVLWPCRQLSLQDAQVSRQQGFCAFWDQHLVGGHARGAACPG